MPGNANLSKTKNNETARKPYRRPQLEVLGDLRSLTLGGSIGTGESGSLVRKVKTSLPHPAGGVTLPDGRIILPDGAVIMPNGAIVPPGEHPEP